MRTNRRTFLTTTAALAAGGLTARAADTDDSKLLQTPHTKFAANIEMWWSKEKDYVKRIEAAAALGFPAIEFWPWQGKNIDAMAEACEKLKMTVTQFTAWGFTPGLNDTANHNKFVEAIDKGCEIAKKLNCKLMCVVGGNDIKGVSQEQMHETIIEGLRKGAPIAEKNDITLILEAMNIRVDHKGHCLYTSPATVKILKAVGSKHVKMLFDCYHMHISEGDTCGHLKEVSDAGFLGYVQIADHPGRTEPGTGEIHYPRIYRQLRDLGYQGYVGVECRPSKSELEAARAVSKSDQW
jgi:hydroxypyruvate isomerase